MYQTGKQLIGTVGASNQGSLTTGAQMIGGLVTGNNTVYFDIDRQILVPSLNFSSPKYWWYK